MMASSFTTQVPSNPFNIPGPSFSFANHVMGSPVSSFSSNEQIKKRRRVEEDAMEGGSPMRQHGQSAEFAAYRGKRFVPITGCDQVFQSENVKPKSETMYLPLTDDILINMNNIEQVSFTNGVFFLGDHSGNYIRSNQGHAINLWRFDVTKQRLYISRSLLFLDIMMLNEVKEMLQYM